MSSQEVLVEHFTAVDPARFHDAPGINVPAEFNIQSVDAELRAEPQKTFSRQTKSGPSLPSGPLGLFKGRFGGPGFNTIFRPSGPDNRVKAANNDDLTETKLDNPINVAGITNVGLVDDNILELNLTQEVLDFSTPVGAVPNRGLDGQQDIVLLGVPYVQSVKDVTNPTTGRGDAPKGRPIHLEPGLFMFVPATDNPKSDPTICRMASIPHGTTINASGLAPSNETLGAPKIDPASAIPNKPLDKLPSLQIKAVNSARLPQNLTKFNDEKTITQAILNDPNTILRNINNFLGSRIVSHYKFTVQAPSADGTGMANIPFLAQGTNPNANATKMTSTFWVEKVRYTIQVPPLKADTAVELTPTDLPPGAKAPTFSVKPNKDTKGGPLTVFSTQIQYSQVVTLTFAGPDWPHVSVASLVPLDPVPVEASVLSKLP